MQHKSQSKGILIDNSKLELKIKSRKKRETKSPLLTGAIEYFVLSIVVKIVKTIMILISLFCPMMSPIYVTITYPRNQATMITFVSNFLVTVSLDTFLWIPICLTMWIHGKKLYNQPRNQGV